MFCMPDSTLDFFIKEDINYIDLTTTFCDIGENIAHIEIRARNLCILCGSEEVVKMAKKLELEILHAEKSGTQIEKNVLIFKAKGKAKNIHLLWKVSVNLLSFASSIATKTNNLVKLARKINPDINVGSTRKSIPGTRALSTKAVLCGGGVIHRLGLDETFLMFDEHKVFFKSNSEIIEKLIGIKKMLVEKMIAIEVKNIEEAVIFAPFVDILQLDKMEIEDISNISSHLKKIGVTTKIVATGGINEKNIQKYAKSGANFLVTSNMFQGQNEIDFGIVIKPI